MVRHTGEHFINVKRIPAALVLSIQSAGIETTKLDTPETDCFATYRDSSFSEQIFDIAVT
jgi:hypothetical protein